MAFFSVKKGVGEKVDNLQGRIYVLKITLDGGEIVHKVGMCRSNRSVDRMMEILCSFFQAYRYVPRCELRRDKKVVVPLKVEQYIHSAMEELSYKFDKKFSGSTEFFSNVDESALLEYLDEWDYSELLKVDSMDVGEYELICQARKDVGPVKGNDELPF